MTTKAQLGEELVRIGNKEIEESFKLKWRVEEYYVHGILPKFQLEEDDDNESTTG